MKASLCCRISSLGIPNSFAVAPVESLHHIRSQTSLSSFPGPVACQSCSPTTWHLFSGQSQLLQERHEGSLIHLPPKP